MPALVSGTRFCGNVPNEVAGPISADPSTVICVDCNLNGIPDAEDIASNPMLDCNINGLIDSCEVADGVTPDANANGQPDECEANTLFVPAEYASIGAAIGAAQSGQTVWIGPGTYSESINPSGKAITIRGSGALTVIDGTQLTGSLLLMVGGEGPGTVIEGITFRNGRVGNSLITSPTLRVGGGIYLENASPTLRNCVFEQCSAQYGGGGYLLNYGGLIEGCAFRSNLAIEDGAGLQIFNYQGISPPIVRNCAFESNVSGFNGGGLHLVGRAGPLLENCLIRLNQSQRGAGGGISWYRAWPAEPDPIALRLRNCTIEDNAVSSSTGSGGGVKAYISGFPVEITDSTLCGNFPTEISGPFTDLGGNVICSPCPADFDHDGRVDGIDLGRLLGAWGTAGPVGDIDGNGVVNGVDLGQLLGSWGPCP
jgi:hypothetical protein